MMIQLAPPRTDKPVFFRFYFYAHNIPSPWTMRKNTRALLDQYRRKTGYPGRPRDRQ